MSQPRGTHTPGPWTVEQGIRGELEIDIVYGEPTQGDRDGGFIANIDCRDDPDDDEDIPREVAIANAHLIAAAPDLYEALKAVIELLRAEAPGTILNNKRFDGIGIQANNALAKAEGRS